MNIERTALLVGALEVFTESGYHGATVRDIAREVGVTVPALYYHHKNKEGMLYELLRSGNVHLAWLCEAAIADGQRDPQIAFANLVECIALFMMHHAKGARLDGEIRMMSEEHQEQYGLVRRRIEEMLTGCIEAGVAEGTFRVSSPRLTTRALLGMLQAISMWYRPDGEQRPERLAAQYVEIARQAIGDSTIRAI